MRFIDKKGKIHTTVAGTIIADMFSRKYVQPNQASRNVTDDFVADDTVEVTSEEIKSEEIKDEVKEDPVDTATVDQAVEQMEQIAAEASGL